MSESTGKPTEATRDQQRELIIAKLDALSAAIEAIKAGEAKREQQLAAVVETVEQLKTDDAQREADRLTLAEILPTLRDMAEAWKSAAWFTKFVKWLAKFVAAIAVITAAWRFGIPGKGG